jgi:hypothetical protein
MKRGDLIVLINSNPIAEGSYGYTFDRDFTPSGKSDLELQSVWAPNGTVGMYWEDSKVEKGKIGVLVEGRLLWFDQLDSRAINETR